jgi:rhodanese-related sulfurtransferase
MSATVDSTIAPGTGREPSFSFVLEHPAAEPAAANRHFISRLAVETDPSDVKLDLERGHPGIVVVDARSAEAWERCHIPGSISLPHRTIGPETTAMLPRDRVIVTYCWGPGCNAATKAAAKLGALGFRVKEMIGGLEYWRHEGSPVEGTEGTSAAMFG